jgi:hypothetical protein
VGSLRGEHTVCNGFGHNVAQSGTTWHSDSGWLQGENLQMGRWRVREIVAGGSCRRGR